MTDEVPLAPEDMVNKILVPDVGILGVTAIASSVNY